MKKCYKCNIFANSDSSVCPLCGTHLEGKSSEKSVFPVIPNMYKKHKLVVRLLLFLSVFGCVLCTVINYLISRKIGWSLFVIAGIVSFWITFAIGIRRRNNFMRLLFGEVMLVLIASVIWDYFTGWHFWSVTFVLPFLCIAYIAALFFLRIFLKNVFKDYIIYIYINSLVGLVPLYFILRNRLTIEWPSILCVLFSIVTILALAIFNHRQMKNELERRLHI